MEMTKRYVVFRSVLNRQPDCVQFRLAAVGRPFRVLPSLSIVSRLNGIDQMMLYDV